MNRRLAALVAATLVSASLVAGCANQTKRDLEGIPAKDPDKTEIYNNVDQYANVVRICIDDVAFAMTTRDYEALTRVPEWDTSFCGAAS